MGYYECDSNYSKFTVSTTDTVYGNEDYGRFFGYIDDDRSLSDILGELIDEIV